jgi:hypothetical protein
MTLTDNDRRRSRKGVRISETRAAKDEDGEADNLVEPNAVSETSPSTWAGVDRMSFVSTAELQVLKPSSAVQT